MNLTLEKFYIVIVMQIKYSKHLLMASALFFMLLTTTVHAAEISAKVDWARKVEMRFPISGVVVKVNTDVGNLVKSNELLSSLDARALQAEVDNRRALLMARTSEFEETQRELQRAQELYDRTMLSDHDLQLAKNKLVLDKANKISAQANLVQARVTLEHSQLRAPFNAIVLQKNVEVGQSVIIGENQPFILLLAASENRLAIATITEKDVAHYQIGGKVLVSYNNKQFSGVIVAMNYAASKSNEIEVKVKFDNGNEFIMPGSTVKIKTQ